jgi:hypothetical protein
MDKTLCTTGYRSALVALIAAVGYSVFQILQIIGIIPKPWDEILIYGFSLCIATTLLLAMLVLHYMTPREKQFWTHAAVIFTAIYAASVSLNYLVQLTAVIP